MVINSWNWHPWKTIVNLRFASFDNGFLQMLISTISIQKKALFIECLHWLFFFLPVQKDNSTSTAFILGTAKPWQWFPVGENFGIRNMNKHSESRKRYISPTGTLNLKQLFYALSRSREKSVKDCFYIINPIYYEKRVV